MGMFVSSELARSVVRITGMRDRASTAADLASGMTAVTSARDRHEAAAALARLALRQLAARSAQVYAVRESPQGLHAEWLAGEGGSGAGRSGATELPLEALEGFGACVRTRRAVDLQAPGGGRWRLVPSVADGRACAVLAVEHGLPPGPGPDLLADTLAGLFANHLALLDYGERDTLTGLLNRKPFLRHYGRSRPRADGVERRAEGAAERWLAVLDIDFFKKINDVHGHLIGDEVLLHLAQVLTAGVRSGDQVFRFGGEEFVILLDDVRPDSAPVVFGRLRRTVESHRFPAVGQVTASIGYARADGSDSPLEVIARADAALYWAKAHGRNRACGYEELVAGGELQAKATGTGSVELF